MTVKGTVRRCKNDTTIGNWRNSPNWRQVYVIQAQLSPIRLLPGFIQEENKIDTALQIENIVMTEVSVDIQKPTVLAAMKTSFSEIWITDERCNAGQLS